MYGDGCFDTLRSFNNALFNPGMHFDRLSEGMKYLGMELPFSREEFEGFIRSGMEEYRSIGEDLIVRTQCWRKGERGYSTTENRCHWMMSFSPVSSSVSEPVTLSDTPIRAIPEESLTRKYKLSNGLNYILAARHAASAGADDVVTQTTSGFISETTIANIFWIKDEQIFTPSLQCDCYPGITRALIIERAGDAGYLVTEGEFRFSDLRQADSVFITNSVSGIRPVSGFMGSVYDTDNPVLVRLSTVFYEYIERNLR